MFWPFYAQKRGELTDTELKSTDSNAISHRQWKAGYYDRRPSPQYLNIVL